MHFSIRPVKGLNSKPDSNAAVAEKIAPISMGYRICDWRMLCHAFLRVRKRPTNKAKSCGEKWLPEQDSNLRQVG